MPDVSPEAIEKTLISGDLAKLDIDQRLSYYKSVCESVGLNPLTQPFDYIALNGKLRLYAKKDATDQLRRIYNISVDELIHDFKESVGLYIVTAQGSRGDRKDASTGAVSVKGLTGDALANAIMKAETKAKRRLTLSICGLGMLDETELETIHAVELSAPTPPLALPAPAVIPTVNHTPAQPTEEPRPNETKKRGRPKKEKVDGAGKPWGGEFELKVSGDGCLSAEAPAPPPPQKATEFPFGSNLPDAPKGDVAPSSEVTSPTPSENMHGVQITDNDLPDMFDKPAPPPDEKPSKEERIAIANRLRKYQVDMPKLGVWVKKTAGVTDTKDITTKQWEQMFTKLDGAIDAKDLIQIVEGK